MPKRYKTLRNSAVAVSLGLGLSIGFAFAGETEMPLTQPEIEAHARTCSLFSARARFQPRTADARLEVMLADSCERAFSSLYHRVDTKAVEAQHARNYLDKLAEFKATIIAINMDRMFGAEHTSRPLDQSTTVQAVAETSGIHPISPTGEYLIARQMGIIGAYREWADVAKFTLAEER